MYIELLSSPLISLSPVVFWVPTQLAVFWVPIQFMLFYFKCHSSYFIESFSLLDSRFSGWNIRESIGLFHFFDFNIFSIQVCCMEIVHIINQHPDSFLNSTKIKICLEDMMLSPVVIRDIQSQLRLFFSHLFSRACFVLCNKQGMVTHNHYVHKWTVSAAVCWWKATAGKSPKDSIPPSWSQSSWNYWLQFLEESLLTVLGDYEEKPQHFSSEILPKTGCLSSSTENLCDHTSGKLQGFLF